MVNKGDVYRHYKHDADGLENNYTYEIIDIGFDTERQEEVIIYRPLYESDIKIFVRPKRNFLEIIQSKEGNFHRFTKI